MARQFAHLGLRAGKIGNVASRTRPTRKSKAMPQPVMSSSAKALRVVRLGRALALTRAVDDEGLREPMQPQLAWF